LSIILAGVYENVPDIFEKEEFYMKHKRISKDQIIHVLRRY